MRNVTEIKNEIFHFEIMNIVFMLIWRTTPDDNQYIF